MKTKITVTISEMDEIDTHAKGTKLEEKFRDYLMTNLGYTNARIRAQLNAQFNNRGTNVDVIAERLDARGVRLKTLSISFLVVSSVSILYGIIGAIYFRDFDIDLELFFIIIGTMIAAASIIVTVLSGKYHKENAWVECKNLKGKATIAQMQKMHGEFSAYVRSGNKQYKFNEVYFVSARGFIENALHYARQFNIKCFVIDEETREFKQVNYWSKN